MTELHAGMAVTSTIRLARPLGAGGMGSVWIADHLALKTQVVVKFMSAALAESPSVVAPPCRTPTVAAPFIKPQGGCP